MTTLYDTFRYTYGESNSLFDIKEKKMSMFRFTHQT